MKRVFSQPVLKYNEQSDFEEEEEEGERAKSAQGGIAGKYRREEVHEGDVNDIAEQVTCVTLHHKRGEEPSGEKYGLWRQEQKTRAGRLEKQLKALEELIEDQLKRFHAHYNRAMVPTRLRDVVRLLAPKRVPAHEMAALTWLGDWRPSAILDLFRALAHSSFSLSSALLESPCCREQTLCQLINEIRIEEAVIDEEMAEIQANCFLHLPFGPMRKTRTSAPASAYFQSEFKKIHRVIAKAQNLRFRALEMVVTKVLSQADAAEFLVAFVGIQDVIHQFATQQKLVKGPVSLPVKDLGCNCDLPKQGTLLKTIRFIEGRRDSSATHQGKAENR